MKLLAIILVLASSLMTAFVIIRKEKMHYEVIRKSVDCMLFIKNRAVFYAEPFKDIIVISSERKEYAQLDFLSNFVEVEEMSPPIAWTEAVRQCKAPLNENEKAILIQFGTELCLCSREQIEELAEIYLSEMSKISEELDKNREKNIKVTSALSLAVGLVIVLIFI